MGWVNETTLQGKGTKTDKEDFPREPPHCLTPEEEVANLNVEEDSGRK